jgi:transcription initiation factor TFIIH subunit 4
MLKYAEDLGVLVWKNDEKRWFFVSAIEQIQALLTRRREGKA